MNDQVPAWLRQSGPSHHAGSYRQSTGGCFVEAIGAGGLEPTAVLERLKRLQAPYAALQAEARAGRLEHLAILDRVDDIEAAEAALDQLSQGARTIVFLGTGGSSLGGQTLAQLNGWNIPGGASAGQKQRPRTRFYDNLDPVTLAGALTSLDLATTRFVVTSKSGGTAETLAQMVAALAAVRSAGLEARVTKLFLAVSDSEAAGGRNALRRLCDGLAIPMLDHPPGIGGRYSALSIVGLLPAMARGLDARAVRRGAREAVARLLDQDENSDEVQTFAPAIGAAIAVALAETRGIRVNVVMPYADRLQRFGHWYVQLWAESLGKGGKGTALIACLGPLDQHSQLQLFMDGPREHYITLIKTPAQGLGPVLPEDLARQAGLGFLAGRAVGGLVMAQADAVAEALMQAGRPVRIMERLTRLDEAGLGALMMHMMIETILAASLLGVDAFDQPAVELAERLARERLEKRT